MASCSRSMVSVSTPFQPTYGFPRSQKVSRNGFCFALKQSSEQDSDCNEEECAPEKEVGKVSIGWLASEKTSVQGTYPPLRKKGWTGYVEKDTAGQTNIYSVEPAVYVAESVISSGSAGSSSDGAENTAAIVAGLALISVAAASSILLQVGKGTPNNIRTTDYTGPSLSFYVNKFKQPQIAEASTLTEPQAPPAAIVEGDETMGVSAIDTTSKE